MSRAAALLLLLLTAACTVPTLDELETERPSSECDTAHPCAGGLACVEGRCVTPPQPECTPNAEASCGVTQGECRAGKKTCDAQGRWGACVGEVAAVSEACNGKDDDCDGTADDNVASVACELQSGVCASKRKVCAGGQVEATCGAATYGQDYEQQETRCDNLDNDCDGSTDEALTQLCPRQSGVCQGARRGCAAGAFPACTDSTYASHANTYQPVEQACDGLDNDCDGRADGWAPVNLSRSDAVSSREVVAVTLAEQVVAAHQEGNGLVIHSYRPDGTSDWLEVVDPRSQDRRAYAPALATDGTRLVGAWVQEQTVGSVVTRQVVVAQPFGLSAQALPLATKGSNPQRLTLALNPSRILVLIEDTPVGGNRTDLWAITVAPDLSDQSEPLLLTGTSGGRGAHASAGDYSDRFLVAWEGRSIHVALVDNEATLLDPSYGEIPATASATSPFIVPEPLDPEEPTPTGFTVYYVTSGGAELRSTTCAYASCAGSTLRIHWPFLRPPLSFKMTPGASASAPLIAAWDAARASADSPREVFTFPVGGSSGTVRQPQRMNPDGVGGYRPVPAVLSSNAGRPYVLFDTAGNPDTVALRDEVLLLPFCL